MARKKKTITASRSSRKPVKTRAQKIEIARVISPTNSIMGLISFNRKSNTYTYSDARTDIVNDDISKLESQLLKNGIKFSAIRFSTYYDRLNKKLV